MAEHGRAVEGRPRQGRLAVSASRQTEALAIEDKVFSSIGKQATSLGARIATCQLGIKFSRKVLSTIRSPPSVATTKSTRDQVNRSCTLGEPGMTA